MLSLRGNTSVQASATSSMILSRAFTHYRETERLHFAGFQYDRSSRPQSKYLLNRSASPDGEVRAALVVSSLSGYMIQIEADLRFSANAVILQRIFHLGEAIARHWTFWITGVTGS